MRGMVVGEGGRSSGVLLYSKYSSCWTLLGIIRKMRGESMDGKGRKIKIDMIRKERKYCIDEEECV